MNRKKLIVLVAIAAAIVIAVIVTVVVVLTRKNSSENKAICERSKNSGLPFCDSSLPINTRVHDLISHLTLEEKIGLVVDQATGASENIILDLYYWWNEALHGVAWNRNAGTFFRSPTEFSTVFPQIISLATSFDRNLFFRMANATGNEAR